MLKVKPISSLSFDSLEPKRLRFVIATIAINIISLALLTYAAWSDWRTGLALYLFNNALLLGFIYLYRDGLLARFMVFCLAVGFTELTADAWLVDYTKTLDYTIGGGPMLWRLPFWMPLVWEVVTLQSCYLALRLQEHFGKFGLVIIGLLSAAYIPCYEEMAQRCHWWKYSGCRMIAHTPCYIIGGELLIAVTLARLVKQFRHSNFVSAITLGVTGGLGIFIAYTFAYGITDAMFWH